MKNVFWGQINSHFFQKHLMTDNNTIWFVLDTNVYLHYRFREIPWTDILKKEFNCSNNIVGIGVPQKVIQEISNIKDTGRGKTQKKAKDISSFFGEVFLKEKKENIPMCLIPLPRDTDFDDVNYHLSNGDDVILLSVAKWNNCSQAIIVSGDNPMLIKAKGNGFKFYQLDDKFRIENELSDEEKKIKELESKLALFQNKMSDISIHFQDNKEYIVYVRPVINEEINESIRVFKDGLETKYPYKYKPNQDAYANPLSLLQNGEYYFSEESFVEYNKDRDKFIKDSLQKKKIEIIANSQELSFKELAFYIENSGTASSGKINIELRFPLEINLYGKPKTIRYNKPSEPQLGYSGYLQSFAQLSLYGHPQQDKTKIWNNDCIINNHIIRLEYESLNHHMSGLINQSIWIDTSNCDSFSIEWQLIDSENPNVFKGKLNVIIR